MTVRRLLAENHHRTTTLRLLTACCSCRQRWLEDTITPKCVWCKEAGKTVSIPVGETVWREGASDGPD